MAEFISNWSSKGGKKLGGRIRITCLLSRSHHDHDHPEQHPIVIDDGHKRSTGVTTTQNYPINFRGLQHFQSSKNS